MAYKPPDFKASGVRAERLIASGTTANPKLIIMGKDAAGNDGTSVNTSDIILNGTGSDSWIFISGSNSSTEKITFGGHSVLSGGLYLREQSVAPGADAGKGLVYVGTDKSLYYVDSDGNSNNISSGGGGGGGDTFFASLTNLEIFTTGSLVATGSITTKDNSGTVGVQLTAAGTVSGSGNFQVGGNITVAGDIALNGGDLTTTSTTANLFNATATTVNIAGGASSATNIGNASGLTTFAGKAKVAGNEISGSVGGNITLQGSGDVEILGDLRVTGNDIKSSTATSITLSGADVAIAGDLTVSGNDIKSSGGSNAIKLSGADVEIVGDLQVTGNDIKSSSGASVISFSGTEVIIPGDLTVRGATTTISTTNLEAKDSLIGLGFASGSVAQAAGDRGFIGGINGGNSVAFVWSDANSMFAATDTNSGVSTSTVNLSNLKPVLASAFRVGGTSATYISSSNSQALDIVAGSTVKISGSQGTSIYANTDGIKLYNDNNLFGSLLGYVDAKTGFYASAGTNSLTLSGSSINLYALSGIVNVASGTSQRLVFDHSDSANIKIATRLPSGGPASNLIITGGNGLTLGTNTVEMNFAFSNLNLGKASNVGGTTFQLGSNSGVSLSLSASNGFNILHGNPGIAIIKNGTSHLFINANTANDSAIYSSNILELSSSASRVLILSGGNSSSQDPRSFADVNFFVSGSGGSAGTLNRGTSLFSGDLAVSGSLKVGSGAAFGQASIVHAATSGGTANIFNTSNTTTLNFGASANLFNFGNGVAASQTFSFGTGAVSAGFTRTFNIGTGGAANSTNNVLIGSPTAGALGTVWIRQPNVIMTGSLQVTGSVYAQNLSGSLTKLSNGADYLRAGSSITLTTGSDGSITIASSGGTPFGSDKQIQFNDGGSFGGDAELTYDKTSNLLILTGSFVNGDGNTASGNYSHAEGEGTTASNVASHAEGKNSSATAIYSHAEGGFTLASGNYSHAEGYLSTASGQFSHAEGTRTVASGDYSHAEGEEATASGTYSHAGGQYTEAAGTGQTVVGKYNIQGNTNSLFVVGDGSSSLRHDILRVNSGSVEITGSLVSTLGISGSLTKLSDGTSYLIAGANVSITTGSNGAVTISSMGGGGGSSYFTDPTSGKINTTGSLSLAGALGATHTTANVGADVFFFASGSKGTIASKASSGLSVFGGDIVTSGSITLDNGSGYGIMHMTAGGELSLRNRYQGGYFVGSVFTSLGSAVNFMEVRPNGYATGSVASIFPGLYAGPANPFSSNDTTFFVSGKRGAKNGIARGASVFGGDVVASGSAYLGTDATDSLVVNSLLASDIIPDGNRTRNLGSESARFANIYTGDLHLRNERGDWTIVEEPDYLSVINNRTGVKYKMMLERIQD